MTGDSRSGPITVAVKKSGLFVFYPLTVIGLSTLAGHFLLDLIIAGINSAHIYIVLWAVKWLW